MAANSKIEWTHHTFNPWQGCSKVSTGCANCYAETLSKRWGKDIWGPGVKRIRTSDAYWKKPLSWNREAEAAGERHRVFCASMADVFEQNDAQPELDEWRFELVELIIRTPNLDWLLLTKRPELVMDTLIRVTSLVNPFDWLPSNIWIGTSVENQEQADKRIPELLKIPAAVRFLSMEPLLGPVDLRDENGSQWAGKTGLSGGTDYLTGEVWQYSTIYGGGKWNYTIDDLDDYREPRIHWVIVGGESGRGARPMHPDWARSLRDQCVDAGIPFFFKQWGAWFPRSQWEDNPYLVLPDDHYAYEGMGHDLHRFQSFDGVEVMHRVGKKKAGRLLDGREWNEVPQPEAVPE